MSFFKKEYTYCKKCGYIRFVLYGGTQEKNCPVCQSMIYNIVYKNFFEIRKLREMNRYDVCNRIRKDYNFPPIEPEWEQKCEEYYKKRSQQYQKKQAAEQQKRVEESFRQFQYKQEHAPKCPSCGSTNISNIGAVERSVSVGVMGLASGKIGKTRKCGNCGYMW